MFATVSELSEIVIVRDFLKQKRLSPCNLVSITNKSNIFEYNDYHYQFTV